MTDQISEAHRRASLHADLLAETIVRLRELEAGLFRDRVGLGTITTARELCERQHDQTTAAWN